MNASRQAAFNSNNDGQHDTVDELLMPARYDIASSDSAVLRGHLRRPARRAVRVGHGGPTPEIFNHALNRISSIYLCSAVVSVRVVTLCECFYRKVS